ncbi:PREDICTED: uncharacterized protein LOC107170464 [Diuraphis noxia]|uniref:uncharacterized protein LOC107170464 n=1 Tax=Diuraphis noxia TaxID=143948 RepID=UPI000763866C|nr:PREDICTED: uncharacterized protein LOC107170464 [Diuraphis noxia]
MRLMQTSTRFRRNSGFGQSYDGAASMQGKYNGLQTKIKEVIFVWCHAHRLDLIITSAVGSCAKSVDLFGNMEKLFTFISCSKKRISMYREKQKKLYPNARVKALKKVATTRWMSQAYALTTVLETLDSILETLEDIKSLEGQVDFKTGAELKQFAKDNNFEFELTLPTRRLRRVPQQPGELSNDEQINDPVMAYKVNT